MSLLLPTPAPVPPKRTAPARLPSAQAWLNGSVRRKAHRTFRVRLLVQAAFALTCVLLGWGFARWLHALETGAAHVPARPPGVDGFLPISGLMGVFDWVYQGRMNTIHPAATVLFLVFVGTAFLLRKSFCSWICPVGLLSDTLGRVSRRLFPRKRVSFVGAAIDAGGRRLGLKRFRLSRAFDVPLRSLKYLLFAFFGYFIVTMTPEALRWGFIETPYNKVTDIRMFNFFAHAGGVTLAVLGLLVALSILVQGVWCRYLCPYGALLGIASMLSPVKVRRNPDTCTDCGICDRVCTSRLPVSQKLSITSAECTGCLDCVASCPVKDTLTVGTRRFRFTPLQYAAALLVLFGLGYGAARVAGTWQNRLTVDEYRQLLPHVEEYGHPGR